MNLGKDNIRTLYFRFLLNAFGAALVACVFGVVDMAMMGHYQGPDGPAALAVISPFWNIIYSLGLLTGLGSSVLASALKGADKKDQNPNEYFTIGLILTLIIGAVEAVIFNVFLTELLSFFGADQTTLPLCLKYLQPIRWGYPIFTLSNFLAASLRNDKAPGLASIAVISGGLFNIVFDYVFIFTCDMGMEGAGLATILGMILNCLIQSIHFFRPNNTLRLVRFKDFFRKSHQIYSIGFSAFFVDAAMAIVNIAFNRQIISLYGSQANNYLAIYGVLINLYVFVQCSAYGIGQASQPLWSFNYGAGLFGRVKKVGLYAMITCALVGSIGLIISESLPVELVKLFMTPNQEVISLAPSCFRPFCFCFIILPFNVVSCYYFQAIIHQNLAFVISIARGALVPLIYVNLLPLLSADFLWYTMLFTELTVGIAVFILVFIFTKKMEKNYPSSLKETKTV